MKLKIKDKMRIIGITTEDLAKKIGVSKQAVYKWMSGFAFPSHDNLVKLAEVLETKPSALISD